MPVEQLQKYHVTINDEGYVIGFSFKRDSWIFTKGNNKVVITKLLREKDPTKALLIIEDFITNN